MKSGLLYLLLVGLPVLALAGVMQVGQRINPPPYVGGLWRVADPATRDGGTCGPPWLSASLPEVEISQSGIVLELISRGEAPRKSQARLDGSSIYAQQVSVSPACPAEWEMEGRFMGSEHDRLVGQWTPVNCDTCRAVAFSAFRVVDSGSPNRLQNH